MQADQSAGAGALKRLEVFIGEWEERVSLPDSPEGRAVFEWALGGQFLIQRSEVDNSDVPDSIVIVPGDPDAAGYIQHYFDSRGVVRVYEMSFADGVWTLFRETPDFSPLNFSPLNFSRSIAGSVDIRHWICRDRGVGLSRCGCGLHWRGRALQASALGWRSRCSWRAVGAPVQHRLRQITTVSVRR
jgi:hypothetical protein